MAAGQAGEERGLGMAGGEGQTDGSGGLDDARGDLDEAQAQRGELGLCEVAGFRDGVAYGQHQPIGAGVQDETNLLAMAERHEVRSDASCALCSLMRFSIWPRAQ